MAELTRRIFVSDHERQAQLQYHEREGERLGQALSAGHAALEDWSYLPPIADDWEEWRGVAKWCALDQRYRFHIEMTIFLRQGEGPFFCPICEESPSEDHESIVCLECAWETVLYNRAIDAARELGRAWGRTREVAA